MATLSFAKKPTALNIANSTPTVQKAPATVAKVTSPVKTPTKVGTSSAGTNTQKTLYPATRPPGDVRVQTPTISKTPGAGYSTGTPYYATPKTISSGPSYTPKTTTYKPPTTTYKPPSSTSTPKSPSTPSYPSTPYPTDDPNYTPNGGGSTPYYPSAPGGDASATSNSTSSANSSALAQMLAVMMPTATSDQSQSQNVFVQAGGGNGPTAPGQADRSFSGQDPGMKQRGMGNYLDALRAGFWG